MTSRSSTRSSRSSTGRARTSSEEHSAFLASSFGFRLLARRGGGGLWLLELRLIFRRLRPLSAAGLVVSAHYLFAVAHKRDHVRNSIRRSARLLQPELGLRCLIE